MSSETAYLDAELQTCMLTDPCAGNARDSMVANGRQHCRPR